MFGFYQDLIALRRNNRTVQDGAYIPLEEGNPNVVAYIRQLGREQIFVLCNFSGDVAHINTPTGLDKHAEILLTNTTVPIKISNQIEFAPYQAFALRVVNEA